MIGMPSERPILLCLNLRREHCRADDDLAWVDSAQAALTHARAEGWRVGHLYQCPSARRVGGRGSIRGLEPLIGEPVGKVRGPVWAMTWLEEWIAEAKAATIFVLGISTADILEQLNAFRFRRIRTLMLIVDARPEWEALPNVELRVRIARTCEFIRGARSNVVVDLAQRRTARRGASEGGEH